MFDEPEPVFGRFRVTAALGDGRFGPVHLGIDPETDQVVVIRAFTEPLLAAQQKRLLESLQELCDRPLDHASIATPLASGVEDGVPYLVHSYLPGTSVDEYLRAHGPRPLADVVVRVTHLAGALDFAAAAGVYHGAMSPRDIIFASQSTGVAGFGLVQAFRAAGVEINEPTPADDIYALAAMTFELLAGYRFTGGTVRDALAPLRGVSAVDFEALVAALEPALSASPDEWPKTALAFAASLHAAQVTSEPGRRATATPPAADVGRLFLGGTGAAAVTTDPVGHERAEDETPAAAPADEDDQATPDDEEFERERVIEADVPAAETVEFDAPLRAGEDADRGSITGDPIHVEPVRHLVSDEYSDGLRDDYSVVADADREFAIEHTPATLAFDAAHDPRHELPPMAPSTAHAASRDVLSGFERTDERSGWRIVAVVAGLAALVLIAVALYLFRGTGDVDLADAREAAEVQEVGDPEVLAPDAGAPDASAPDAGGPGVRGPGADVPEPDAAAGGAAPDRTVAPPAVVQEPLAPRTAAPQPAPQTPAPQTPSRQPDTAAARGAGAAPARGAGATGAPLAGVREDGTTGRVLVRSMPSGARVLVDGMPRGETPVAIRDLPFGAHVITVTAPGQPQWQQTVTLSPARPAQSLEVSLDGTPVAPSATPAPAGTAAAGLQIESRPSGAQVWVDGAPAGVTPVVVPSVAAGTHSVRIELSGYQPWSTSVSVTAGQRARVAASLEQ